MTFIPQKPFGKIAARLFGEALKIHPMLGQAPMKGPRTQPKAARDLGHLRRAFAQGLRDGRLGLRHDFRFAGDLRKLRVEMRGEIL